MRKDNGGENPLGNYQKYYKLYFARVKAGSLKTKKFKLWKYAVFRNVMSAWRGR